ncbi:MAG: hypothetical protein IPO73_14540 [Gemmatimonadetes bacterium]|nr:hypothetical protein [Gemmatimonadota bacterium]
MRRTSWMALAAVAVLTACGGDGNGSVGPGNGGAGFSADVQGDIETSIKGDALFGNASDPEAGTIFAIEMAEDDATGGGLIQLIRIGDGVPGVGTYQLTDAVNGTPQEGDWVAAAYDSDHGQLTAIFAATSGSVKVTRNANGVYEGTFDFIAIGGALSDPTTEMTIAVHGKFKATQSPGSALRSLPRVRSR